MASTRSIRLKQNALALVIWTTALLGAALYAMPILQEFYIGALPVLP